MAKAGGYQSVRVNRVAERAGNCSEPMVVGGGKARQAKKSNVIRKSREKARGWCHGETICVRSADLVYW